MNMWTNYCNLQNVKKSKKKPPKNNNNIDIITLYMISKTEFSTNIILNIYYRRVYNLRQCSI